MDRLSLYAHSLPGDNQSLSIGVGLQSGVTFVASFRPSHLSIN